MKSLLKFLFMMGFGVVQTLTGGFVLSKLWGWFITAAFSGAPGLTYMKAVGLIFTINFLLMGLSMKDWDKDWNKKPTISDEPDWMTKSIIKSLVMVLLVYPLTLLSAYVWHQFIQ